MIDPLRGFWIPGGGYRNLSDFIDSYVSFSARQRPTIIVAILRPAHPAALSLLSVRCVKKPKPSVSAADTVANETVVWREL